VAEDALGPLIGLAAVTELLLDWARRPGVDHLAGDHLLADLRELLARIEHELAARTRRG
jgi:hypothetical protein